MAASSGHRVGIILALAAAAFFGVSHSVVVLAYRGGSNPLSVSATRFILPIVVLMAFLAFKRRKILMPRRQGAWAMVLGLMTAIYTLALLLSLDFLPAGIAILVFYLFPIFTGIIVAIMGWTPFDRKTSIAALVALLGLGLALGLRLDDYNSTGLALAVVAALGLAVVSAFSARVIAASDPLRVTVYMSVGALVCLAVTVSAMDEFRLPTTESGWVGFILSHVFFAIAVIAYFVAIDKVGPSISATLSNLQPLIVIAIAFLILGQSLAPLQLVGAIIVVGALIAAAREGPKVRQSMSAVPPEGDETG